MTLEGRTFFFAWEGRLMAALQARLGAGSVGVISALSMLGEELVLILVLGFLYWSYDKQMGRRVGRAILMGVVWNPMVKNIFCRRRPYFDVEGVSILRVVEPKADPYDIVAQGYSFPSGHSTNAAALFGSLALEMKKRWMTVLAIALPLAVGFSRVAVGAHFPTDVLVGWLLGAAAIALCAAITRWLGESWQRDALLLLTALPGLFYCRSADYFTGFGLLAGFIAGTALEARAVRFANTRSLPRQVLRVVCGVALYVLLNTAFKLPFDKAFLASGTMAALLVRCLRYALIGFIEFGVYPMLFAKTDALFRANAKEA